MPLAPDLEPENLRTIAQSMELTPELLDALETHPASWGQLRAWVTYVRATGTRPPVPQVVVEEDMAGEPPAPPSRRRFPLLAVAAGVLVVASAAALWWWLDLSSDDPAPSASAAPSVPSATSEASVQPTESVPARPLAASGDAFACTAQGTSVHCLGQNRRGQLGTGLTEGFSAVHEHTFDLPEPAVWLTAGAAHACAGTSENVYCWGDNEWHQAGEGDEIAAPAPVKELAGKPISGLVAGEIHTCALAEEKTYCWGSDYVGQLGSGKQGAEGQGVTAVDVPAAQQLSASRFSTCALAADQWYCWGSNLDSRLVSGGEEIVPPTAIGGDGS